jgi:translation initiation factor 2 subunit 2
MDYQARLDRAMDAVPDFRGSETRLNVPGAEAHPDGAFTRLNNLGAIADALNREPEHVHRALQRELGTNAQIREGVSRFNGSFSDEDLDAAIDSYVEEYVTCSECGLPDTRLTTENGTQMLRCEACGAFRPVAKQSRSTTQQADRDAVEAGETYEVKITGTGRKGDGVAEKGKYTIFVTGAQEGQVVNIEVDRVSGTLAFAHMV